MTTTAPDSALSAAECLRLLRPVPVGLMVPHRERGAGAASGDLRRRRGEVVVPTDDESFARFDGEFLAFEAGDIDPITRIGWSGTALGHATYLSFADAVARFHDRNAVPWSIHPGDWTLIIDMDTCLAATSR
ncbi:pyridoxamine 5'-phosphate oxidase family protein [Rhodococcus sp. NPDC059968]|uniref:pyridoxamine 5'-phosphate oxidase family protein n=1 Tax=Rhodococcus sp. NPDC059968 TaxID=3347017 RepID=UPI00367257FF